MHVMATVVAAQFSSIQRPSCFSSNPPSLPPRAPHPTQATLSQTRYHSGDGYHQLPAWRVQGDNGKDHPHRPRCLRSPLRISRNHLHRLPRRPHPCQRYLLCRTLLIIGGAAIEISRPHLPRRHRWVGFVNE